MYAHTQAHTPSTRFIRFSYYPLGKNAHRYTHMPVYINAICWPPSMLDGDVRYIYRRTEIWHIRRSTFGLSSAISSRCVSRKANLVISFSVFSFTMLVYYNMYIYMILYVRVCATHICPTNWMDSIDLIAYARWRRIPSYVWEWNWFAQAFCWIGPNIPGYEYTILKIE